MKEQKLSWRARGRLWFRIGVRLVLLIVGLWLLWKVGLPLLSLLGPFVAALIGIFAFHEAVTPYKLLGMAAIFGAILILNRRP